MSELYQEILNLAEQIRTNRAEGSNTAELVGSTLKKIADYVKERMVDDAESDANAYADGLVATERAERQSADTAMQSDITEATTLINSETSARQAAVSSLQGDVSALEGRKLDLGRANGKVTMKITDEAGEQTFSFVDIYGASTSLAGAMTAADKSKLDSLPAGANAATKNYVDGKVNELQEDVENTCPTSALSISTPAGASVVFANVNEEEVFSFFIGLPTQPNEAQHNPGAAGLMSPADKAKLDGLPANAQPRLLHITETSNTLSLEPQAMSISCDTLDVDVNLVEFQSSVNFYGGVTFSDEVEAPTPAAGDNSTSVATTAYVQTELTALRNRLSALESQLSGN